jgi:hypothetical protein
MISDEMFAAVIDGAATPEERRLVYNAIEGDEKLRQAFNDSIYLKIFGEEIEADFNARHPDAANELSMAIETTDVTATVFNGVGSLSMRALIDSASAEIRKQEE